MAERRMFSKTVTQAARFLMMPASARLLYYDLGMAADDDGAVEAFAVLRLTGASMEDLNTLVAKGYVKILNDELVSYICDWKRNNLIKGDRYRPSVYKDLLPAEALDDKNSDPEPIRNPSGTQVDPKWNPNGTQVEPQDRLGKDSIEKDRIGEGRENAEPQTAVAAEAAAPSPTPQEDVFSLVSEGISRKYLEERQHRAEDYAKAHKRPVISVLREWWARDKDSYSEPMQSFDTDDFFAAALERSLKSMSG